MELLTNHIRNNENISGVNICGCELKHVSYADGAYFILDESKISFEYLVTILENFSNISGLKLNVKEMSSFENRSYQKNGCYIYEKRKFQ